jgi:hypothetical protein
LKKFNPRYWIPDPGYRIPAKDIKSLSLNKFSPSNPPLKKGEIGGFALTRLAEIPPAPLYERGEILFTDKL